MRALLRCHGLDEQGLYWFEEPVVFDNFAQSAQLARELKTPVQIGENISMDPARSSRRCKPKPPTFICRT
jgi:hypothetical protein